MPGGVNGHRLNSLRLKVYLLRVQRGNLHIYNSLGVQYTFFFLFGTEGVRPDLENVPYYTYCICPKKNDIVGLFDKLIRMDKKKNVLLINANLKDESVSI